MRAKQRKHMLAAGLIFTALLVVWLGMVGLKVQGRGSQNSLTLYTLPETAVTAMEFGPENGRIRLVREGEKWLLEADKEFPLNQSYAANMLKKLSRLTAVRHVSEDGNQWETYGLNRPSLTVSFQTADQRTTICLGDQNGATGDYYMATEGSEKVYMVDSSFHQLFSTGLYQMAVRETLPDLKMEGLAGVSLRQGDQTVSFQKKEGLWTAEQGVESWSYGDGNTLTPLISDLVRLRFGDMVAYRPDFKTLGTYGLDKPWLTLKIDFIGENAPPYLLYVSEPVQESCYAYADGGYGVYRMDRELLEPLGQLKPENYLPLDVMPIREEELTGLILETNGKEYKFDLSSGAWLLNGNPLPEQEFTAFYYQLFGLKGERRVSDLSGELTGIPEFTVTYMRGDEAEMVEFFSGENGYYAVKIGGKAEILVNRNQITGLMEAVEAME